MCHGVAAEMGYSWSATGLTIAYLRKTVGDPAAEGQSGAGLESDVTFGELLRPMFLIRLDPALRD
jgi:hypothetical protein